MRLSTKSRFAVTAMNARLLDLTQSVSLKSLLLEPLAKNVTMEQKSLPQRGVYRKPERAFVRSPMPNPVFALGQAVPAQS